MIVAAWSCGCLLACMFTPGGTVKADIVSANVDLGRFTHSLCFRGVTEPIIRTRDIE